MATNQQTNELTNHTTINRFRYLVLTAALMTFGLITMGGIVRVTGSGLGCPDWPTCHGQLIPPMRVDAIIEYLHRLIAALTLGVVVVEAARKSGALITARLAGEMGKEVFAVPGDIGRPQTRGPHQLIRDGAKLVESVEDILDELGPLTGPLRVRDDESPLPDPRALLLNPHERKVYDLLDSVPKDIDLLTRESGLSAANAASILMVLELRHLAVQMPGKLYVRAGTLSR